MWGDIDVRGGEKGRMLMSAAVVLHFSVAFPFATLHDTPAELICPSLLLCVTSRPLSFSVLFSCFHYLPTFSGPTGE